MHLPREKKFTLWRQYKRAVFGKFPVICEKFSRLLENYVPNTFARNLIITFSNQNAIGRDKLINAINFLGAPQSMAPR